MTHEELQNKPIGVFDSGVGGLTVVAEIFKLLPGENIVYFGDVGRSPYGGRSKETIINFARQDVRFLMEHQVKILIVACNSVSAVALDTLQEEFDIDILGVIEPGAEAAMNQSKNNRIGIIGTKATIGSDSYARAIQRRRQETKVFSLACPLFVPLAEEGYIEKEATHLIAHDYLKTLLDLDIDTLILGCTHYPLLKTVIGKVMGENVRLIDSAEETARELAAVLSVRNLLRPSGREAMHKFYVSDVPDKFSQIAERFLGRHINNITRVDITRY
ncbi:MAG: glutamate racemase [candidate division Zixibacteria bacterium HGW-Zixibacteria-1]|nr:MAG: glutamate racemase [candidate division Zixibacteria bacterium HGW-Zixibacteria-1]